MEEMLNGQTGVYVFPASYAQQRLWFLDQLMPGSAMYNMPFAVRMTGDLQVTVLEKSLQEIIARHETLRTTFEMEEGQLMQVVAPELAFQLPVVQVQGATEAERERHVAQFATDYALAPFDLEKGPLLRATLVALDRADHVLFVSMHHIIADGWSLGVLVRDMMAIYGAFANGQESPLEELPVQYVDYTDWHNEWMQGEVLDEQLTYWKQQFLGALPVLQLPTDRTRPAVQHHRGAKAKFALSVPLSQQLATLSQTEGVTLFMTLLAAFQTLLYRYTGQDDIVVGTPIAGRNREEIEGLIGCFVNTLALRSDLSGTPTFRELLQQVKSVTLDAYTHQDLPFDRLIEELQPERSLGQTPLFQVLFVLQNAPLSATQIGNVAIAPYPLETGTAKFDLSLEMEETAHGLCGTFEFATELFEEATIQRMIAHFQTLLEAIVSNPVQQVSSYSMLTEAETQALLADEQNGCGDFVKAACLHQLFEAHVARTPDHVAVRCGEERLTYQELNRRANALASHLQARGVGQEVPVLLFLDRSLDLMIGLLGIWKAGGAFVPIDPMYPQERIALIAEDSQAPVWLTKQGLRDLLPSGEAVVVCLDEMDFTAEKAETAETALGNENLPCHVQPENLAAMIYTSGSTGRPKAVLVEHRNLSSTLTAALAHYELREGDVMPWVASVAFDIGMFEGLMSLFIGGTTVIITREQVLDVRLLVKELAGVTAFHAVPSLLRQIVQTVSDHGLSPQDFAGVRTVFTGGEAVLPDLLEEIKAIFTQADVYVLYGPTEAAILSTHHLVSRDIVLERPVIGTAMYQAQLRVYDAHQNLVPVGVPGELYIGGPNVTRGYARREELTSEKFVVIDGKRWYRSGDLVTRGADGVLQYGGRIDDQVKIRGFRIELGEIETWLGMYDGVQECVVTVFEAAPSDKRLVAYLATQTACSADEIRAYLKQKVPEYMVPAHFVFLDQLPHSSNGKIDRRALPTPEITIGQREYVAPRTPLEETLARIWSDVLRLDRVGIQDHFFEIGGHSLLATQVISRIRKELSIELPLRTLFEAFTIADMAGVIEKQMEQSTPADAPTIKRLARKRDK